MADFEAAGAVAVFIEDDFLGALEEALVEGGAFGGGELAVGGGLEGEGF